MRILNKNVRSNLKSLKERAKKAIAQEPLHFQRKLLEPYMSVQHAYVLIM